MLQLTLVMIQYLLLPRKSSELTSYVIHEK